jgi:IS30 family transposase
MAIPRQADLLGWRHASYMEGVGRRAASTREERLRVRVLAQEGLSVREIAERVFGDRRLHGRVERTLKRERALRDDPERDSKICSRASRRLPAS